MSEIPPETIFYNYHEYSSNPSNLPKSPVVGTRINHLVTHFPNPHVPLDSPLAGKSRIVRIPREFLSNNDLYPSFSEYFPGTEPGALKPDVEAESFLSSESPLRFLMSNEELLEIVQKINEYSCKAFSPYSWRNVVDNVLGVLSWWTFDLVFVTNCKRVLRELENYIEETNRLLAGRRIQIMNPVRTGFVSVGEIWERKRLQSRHVLY